ncbi:MAG: class I SAM-dependent DNA methyltransferase [Candidatus Odinarchaeota archaeon]
MLKKVFGQYFTPMMVCNYMVQLGLRSFEKRAISVLDPSCGRGNFLVACIENFNRFLGRKNFQLELWGIEIDNIELSNAVAILSSTREQYETSGFQIVLNLLNHDFFEILFERPPSFPDYFDIIIGNPPYVRHELILNKEEFRKRICFINSRYEENGYRCGTTAEHCYNCKKTSYVPLGSKADMYCYFITAATKLLVNQGLLLFIIPTKWLYSNYGLKLREFIINNFKIDSLILVEKNLFPGVLVDSIIVELRKETNDKKRNSNVLNYAMLETITNGQVMSNIPCITNHRKIVQENLRGSKNWYRYLEQPAFLEQVLKQREFIPLGDSKLSQVKWGLKTGAENFFFLTSRQIKEYQIPSEFLKPAIKSPKDLFKDNGHHLYSCLLVIPPMEKNELPAGILKYINLGEQMQLNKRASIKSRKPWYSISVNKIPDIIVPNFIWQARLLFLENTERVIPSYNFHTIHLTDQSYSNYLLALLNSSFGELFLELFGRSEGGGVLHLQTCDLTDIPILDPTTVIFSEKQELEGLYIELHELASKPQEDFKLFEKTKKSLDECISALFTQDSGHISKKSDELFKQIREQVSKLRYRRINRAKRQQ